MSGKSLAARSRSRRKSPSGRPAAAVADPSLGTGLTGENVAVLAAWGIAGLIVAARGFRWEPQAHRG